MKKFVLFLFIMFSITLINSQNKTLYVGSKSDKRLIAYKDSLNKWIKHEEIKKHDADLLQKADDLNEYNIVSKVLGYSDTDLPTTNDKKFLYSDQKKSYIQSELVTCFHAIGGEMSCVYTRIVKKPSIIVVYKPPVFKTDTVEQKNINVLYTTLNTKGEISLDSSKSFVVNASYKFIK